MKLNGEWVVIESADVTRARSALAAESRFISALLDAAAAFVVTLDADGRVLRCNAACERITGVPHEQMEGRPVWEWLDLPAERIKERLDETWSAGGFATFESRLPTHDGREMWVSWSTAGVHDKEGDLAHIVVTGQDITEHKLAQDRLKEAYEMEHHIARTLQESLLRPVPEIDGLEIGVVYRPAVEIERVGGDFYDIYPIGPDRVVALVGDVSGKGVAAAGMTETVRSMIRALLYMDVSPDEALSRAGRALYDQTKPEQFVTVGMAVLDLATGAVEYASAGHPAPCICGARTGEADVVPGIPLGAEVFDYEKTCLRLERNECLVMYTDGLSEARVDGKLFGDGPLLETLRDGGCDPGSVVKRLLDAVEGFSPGPLADDIAIVALQRQ